VSGDSFKVEVSSNMGMSVKTVTETIAETMAAIVKYDNDWYGWALTDRTPATILAAAAWTESVRKLFGTSIAEPGAYDPEVTTDTGYLLYNDNYFRTFWFYHEKAATDFPETAVFARCFAILPGGETWALKKLAGVTTDNLTETQYNAITKKNGNTFERFRNISISNPLSNTFYDCSLTDTGFTCNKQVRLCLTSKYLEYYVKLVLKSYDSAKFSGTCLSGLVNTVLAKTAFCRRGLLCEFVAFHKWSLYIRTSCHLGTNVRWSEGKGLQLVERESYTRSDQ
jgi:hypothetical protein